MHAVVTANDLPDLRDKMADLGEGRVNLAHLGANVLAHGKVLYKGHAVAAVAAISPHVAEEAVKLIQVDYEPLPAVTWVLDAMKPDAPLLHDDVFTEDMAGQRVSQKPNNASKYLLFEAGDIEKGFASADVVIEREFKTATVHQGYIEPHVSTALWNAGRAFDDLDRTQGSFTARQQTAELLQIPVSQVTVVPCEIGGGFGGKIPVYLEPVAALLSRKCGRPVKMVDDAGRSVRGHRPDARLVHRVKLGAKKDGRIVAGQAWLAYDAGAYPGGMIGPGCMCVFSCYDIPNYRVDGYDVVLNKPKTAAYRAPGATQAAFAAEKVVDELAEQLKIDPLEFRLKNAAQARDQARRLARLSQDRPDRNARSRQEPSALQGAAARARYRGRGVAAGFWFNIGLKSCAIGQRQPRRHGQPRRRLDRHRRHAHRRSPCNWPRRWASPPRTSIRRSPTPTASATPTSPAAAASPSPPAWPPTSAASTSAGKWPSGPPRSGTASRTT